MQVGEKNNSYIPYKLENGEEVLLTLNLRDLYKLKSIRQEIYEKCSGFLIKGITDFLDQIDIVYVAYLCANIDTIDKCYKAEEFLELMPQSVIELKTIVNKLLMPKKK